MASISFYSEIIYYLELGPEYFIDLFYWNVSVSFFNAENIYLLTISKKPKTYKVIINAYSILYIL